MDKVIILDSVLSEPELEESLKYDLSTYPNFPDREVEHRWENPYVQRWVADRNFPSYEKLLTLAGAYVDLRHRVGYEVVTNIVPQPMHFDRDDLLWSSKKIMKFPLCSIVYYPYVNVLEGGQLHIEGEDFEVKTNRMILFPSGKMHRAKPFKGTRISVGILPWDEVPMAYQN
jgi:hypothetical protein